MNVVIVRHATCETSKFPEKRFHHLCHCKYEARKDSRGGRCQFFCSKVCTLEILFSRCDLFSGLYYIILNHLSQQKKKHVGVYTPIEQWGKAGVNRMDCAPQASAFLSSMFAVCMSKKKGSHFSIKFTMVLGRFQKHPERQSPLTISLSKLNHNIALGQVADDRPPHR